MEKALTPGPWQAGAAPHRTIVPPATYSKGGCMARGQGAPRADWDPRGIAPKHENLGKAISARGLHQQDFAKLLRVSPSRLDRWLHGADSAAQTIPNDKLAEAARMLGVSAWYLLDLTDSIDGDGARPLACHRSMVKWWKVAQDTYQAAQWYHYKDYQQSYIDGMGREIVLKTVHIVDEPGRGDQEPPDLHSGSWQEVFDPADPDAGEGMELQSWNLARKGGRLSISLDRLRGGRDFLMLDMEDSLDKARQIPSYADTDEARAAAEGASAYMEWFRKDRADRFTISLLSLKGDFRNPAGVVSALAKFAADHGGTEDFDATAAEVDKALRRAAAGSVS